MFSKTAPHGNGKQEFIAPAQTAVCNADLDGDFADRADRSFPIHTRNKRTSLSHEECHAGGNSNAPLARLQTLTEEGLQTIQEKGAPWHSDSGPHALPCGP